MDFKITKFLGSALTLSKVKTSLDEGANKKSAADLKELLKDESLDVSYVRDSNGIPTTNNAENFAGKAATAVDAIRQVRERQLELAAEAYSTSNPERQSTLNSELSTLDTEISRIASAATYNGVNALAGRTVTIENDGQEIHTAVAIPDYSSLATDPGVTLTSQSNALTALNTLADLVGAARDAVDGASVALTRAAQTEELGVVEPKLGGTESIRDIDQAKALADKIASEIRTNYPPGANDDDIVLSNLDPSRVAELLA